MATHRSPTPVRDGAAIWTTKDLEQSNFEKVVDLLNEGLSQREVADELDLDKSWVSRLARKAKTEGLVK